MNLKIAEFNVLAADEAAWNGFFGVMDEFQLETSPEDPLLPREKRKALMIAYESSPYRKVYRFLAFSEENPGEAAGFVSAAVETPSSPSYESNRHIGNLTVIAAKKYRGGGLGALLLKRVITELAAKEPSVSELLTPVTLKSGERFMERLGATVSLETAENRLVLKEVDWAMVEAWAAEGGRRNPGTSLVTVSVIPQEDIEDYSAAYSETINQQPLGDVTIKMKYTPEQVRYGEVKNLEQGVDHTTMYTRESDGRVSGLTETMYLAEADYRATQLLTGVREQYRGRGLGKLLKARMLLHIRKEYPGVNYIVTGNADSNGPMLAINNKLGFKKHLPVKLYKLKLNVK